MSSRMSDVERIKQEYLKLHGEMIKKGELIRPTEKGYSGSASAETVHKFFTGLGLENYSSFLDLGSGDGKVVLVASLFTRAAGIEADEQLVCTAQKMRERLGLKNAGFTAGDFLEAGITGYGILFINPDQPLYDVEKKLRNEMAEEQRLAVFGGLYKPLNMTLEKEHDIDGVWFGVYVNR